MDASSLSLLFAVCVPVLVIAGLHAWLALNGERGTLLLPDTGPYESKSSPVLVLMAMAAASARARAEANARLLEAANDETIHEAA